MIPHAIASGDITKNQLLAFEWVTEALLVLPDGLSCHEVCQRLSEAFGGQEGPLPLKEKVSLIWERGTFNGWDHSWLRPIDLGGQPHHKQVIIDAYPWASASPFIITTVTGSPWATLYRESPPRSGMKTLTKEEFRLLNSGPKFDQALTRAQGWGETR